MLKQKIENVIAGQQVEKAREHVRANKNAYIAGSVGAVVGGVSVFLGVRQVSVTQKAKNIALLNWKPVNNMEQTTVLVRRGHPGNIIKCVQTGELFASQNRAAEALDISRSNLSEHLNGFQPAVSGYTFEKMGEATATNLAK